MCGILLCVHRNDNTSYLKEKYSLIEKSTLTALGWMRSFQNKLRISYEFVKTTMCTKSVKIIIGKTKHWMVCICRVHNFPRLVIRPLTMRNLINMKSVTSNWEISHHSRKYYHLLHILLQKVFSGVLKKSFTAWLTESQWQEASSTQNYQIFTKLSVPSMAKYSTLLGCVLFLTEFIETTTKQTNKQNQCGKPEAIALFPHPDLTSFVYVINLQILKISNSGDSRTDSFLKTQTTSNQIY